MKLLKVQLTDGQKKFCERRLKRWDLFCSDYTKDAFTQKLIGMLLKYEIDTRRRKDVMSRLAGRYAKLKRANDWKRINAYIGITPAEMPILLEEAE